MTEQSEAADRGMRLGQLYAEWVAAHPDPLAEPDDDPEYVARAREIMGLPPLADTLEP